MQTVPIHRLDKLSNEECWLLFSKHAFENGRPTARFQADLEEIGKKIVDKCNGLPLAAKTMGCLLRSKVKIQKWEKVLQSEIWELPSGQSNILPALLLSYIHLPSHLKRCFAYCAIIPKDYEFEKEMLVRLWIAEGFVQQLRSSRGIEEMGADYFRELISRSLLQHSGGDKFVMHDLIIDLAQFVSGEFCFRYQENKPLDISKVRHCSLFTKSHSLPEGIVINEFKCLRTFLPLADGYTLLPSMKVRDDLFTKLRCLRVLSLRRYVIDELPESIGDLIHLRYLDLSDTGIKCLPESISGLCNLETLLLQDCEYLTRLPKYLYKLICLRLLDISKTTYLEEMPKQMGRLSSLQLLTRFIVGKDGGRTISELRELHHLRGAISISNLQNVIDGREAMEANLKNKKQLEGLTLDWSQKLSLRDKLILKWSGKVTVDSEKERDILDKLQPHANLQYLRIGNYSGASFPDWVGDHTFLNMKSLHLYTCTCSLSLPPLGELPTLKDLTIEGMSGLVKVGSEFYGNVGINKPFQSLERLRFDDMQEWEEWYILGAGEFSHLQELCIIECPKLKGELPKHLPFLKKLKIDECPSLVIENILEGGPELDSVITAFKELSISPQEDLEHHHHYKSLEGLEIRRSCDSLEFLQLSVFPKLRSLKIHFCGYLKSLSVINNVLQNLPSLQSLSIYGCPELESLAEAGLPAPNLIEIGIRRCEKMKSLPQQMCTLLPSLHSLRLQDCPEIESSFPEEGGLPRSLSTLEIINCKKLMGRRREWGLQRLPSLKLLQIGGESEEDTLVEYSFPEECLFPSTLTSLKIYDRQNMKTLNPNGLRHLHSLQILWIQNCQNLQCLPDEGLPTSLSILSIWNCPLLTKRCKRGKGKDWLKIAHIPHTQIY